VATAHHHCRSPTPTLNGCDLTPSTRTQSSEQEYSYLAASMRHPSTPYSRNTPQSFSRGTRPYTFPISTKHVYTSLGCSQDFSKICWRVEICSVVLRPFTKIAVSIIQLWFHYFCGILAYTRPWEAKQRYVLAVGSFTPVYVFVYGMISLPIFR